MTDWLMPWPPYLQNDISLKSALEPSRDDVGSRPVDAEAIGFRNPLDDFAQILELVAWSTDADRLVKTLASRGDERQILC